MNLHHRTIAFLLDLAPLALAAVAAAGAVSCQRGTAAPLPEPQAFESLGGTPVPSHGYHFAVSPDEEWIAKLRMGAAARDTTLRVLHRRSGKVWDCPLSTFPVAGFPDCFSADSKQVVLGGRVASLSPSMRGLELTKPPGAAPQGTCLGFPRHLARGRGGLAGIPQAEGEFGEVARSEDGTESVGVRLAVLLDLRVSE